jgi:hypothetical protein
MRKITGEGRVNQIVDGRHSKMIGSTTGQRIVWCGKILKLSRSEKKMVGKKDARRVLRHWKKIRSTKPLCHFG